jgi:hypothetical protein
MSLACISKGLAKIKLRDYIGAISDFDMAIKLAPDAYLPYFSRGGVKN